MLDALFQSLFNPASNVISPGKFLLCVGASLIIGLVLALMSSWKTRCSESFAITLALLPATVCVVIMMVNGNVGPVWPWQALSVWFASAARQAAAGKSAQYSSRWAPD